jgi:hypothetical protein
LLSTSFHSLRKPSQTCKTWLLNINNIKTLRMCSPQTYLFWLTSFF